MTNQDEPGAKMMLIESHPTVTMSYSSDSTPAAPTGRSSARARGRGPHGPGRQQPLRVSSSSSSGYRTSHRSYGAPSPMMSSSSTTYRKAGGRSYASAGRRGPDAVHGVTNELKIIRTNEKEQLQGLNDRFVFIEKVHTLEQQNKVLEAEVTMLRQRHSEPSRLHDLYEGRSASCAHARKSCPTRRARCTWSACRSETLERVREKLDEEVRARDEARRARSVPPQGRGRRHAGAPELEKKVEALLDEVAFLRKVHEEELQELQASLQARR
ncbi:Low molecular weight neuronal intermediate filament [Merluccius polli]|uniref:Low molecular weight neuronal intermediate filament n=1 Tax=Merluccius polli TaxID=89951 RepID=A0AA47MFI9_MERPO|nr:Low molecular weight neuronal intermediate filament [Merluccius polli]